MTINIHLMTCNILFTLGNHSGLLVVINIVFVTIFFKNHSNVQSKHVHWCLNKGQPLLLILSRLTDWWDWLVFSTTSAVSQPYNGSLLKDQEPSWPVFKYSFHFWFHSITYGGGLCYLLPSGWNAVLLMGPKWPLTLPNSSSNTRW